MKRLLKTIAIALLFSGCVPKEKDAPADNLSPAKFTAIMIDVQLSEGMKSQRKRSVTDLNPESVNYEGIFEKHEVTRENFLKTYAYYREHPGDMEKIYETVLDSLNKLESKIKQNDVAEQRALKDSLNAANRRMRDSTLGKLKPR